MRVFFTCLKCVSSSNGLWVGQFLAPTSWKFTTQPPTAYFNHPIFLFSFPISTPFFLIKTSWLLRKIPRKTLTFPYRAHFVCVNLFRQHVKARPNITCLFSCVVCVKRLLSCSFNSKVCSSNDNFQKEHRLMGKTLDALLGRSFKPSKFKSLVNLAISRLSVLKNQRQVRCNQARSDVVQLLELGHHDRALLRVRLGNVSLFSYLFLPSTFS